MNKAAAALSGEGLVVRGNIRAETRGQIAAFLLGLVAIVGGIGLIGYDKDVQGLTAMIAAFVALAGVFIYGRRQQERERERKRREIEAAAAQPRLPFEPS